MFWLLRLAFAACARLLRSVCGDSGAARDLAELWEEMFEEV